MLDWIDCPLQRKVKEIDFEPIPFDEDENDVSFDKYFNIGRCGLTSNRLFTNSAVKE